MYLLRAGLEAWGKKDEKDQKEAASKTKGR
jgi:hypothetical protein